MISFPVKVMSERHTCSVAFRVVPSGGGGKTKTSLNYWDIKLSPTSSGSANNVRSERMGSQVWFSWGALALAKQLFSLRIPSKESGERPVGTSLSFYSSCLWRARLPGNQVSGSLCAYIRLGNVAVLKLSVAGTYTEMPWGLENYVFNSSQ